VAESFFATIKREFIYTRPWPTRAGLHRAVFEYIEGWCNARLQVRTRCLTAVHASPRAE
jgi:hypothetical protein